MQASQSAERAEHHTAQTADGEQDTPSTADKHPDASEAADTFDFMVVSNRLPVDRCSPDEPGCEDGWRRSPGGLVTALAPMMTKTDGAWVGWHGAPDEHLEPFSHRGIDLIPVQLSTRDIELFLLPPAQNLLGNNFSREHCSLLLLVQSAPVLTRGIPLRDVDTTFVATVALPRIRSAFGLIRFAARAAND